MPVTMMNRLNVEHDPEAVDTLRRNTNVSKRRNNIKAITGPTDYTMIYYWLYALAFYHGNHH